MAHRQQAGSDNNTPSTAKGNDTQIKPQFHSFTPAQLRDYIVENRLTHNQICKIGLDFKTVRVNLGVTSAGLDATTKAMLVIPFGNGEGFLANVVNLPNGAQAFEGSHNAAQFPGIEDVLAAMAQVRDHKTGKTATDIYASAPNAQVAQFLHMSGKGVEQLFEVGSIRYHKELNVVSAFLKNQKGKATEIGIMSVMAFHDDTGKLGQHRFWTGHTKADSRDMVMQGRPNKNAMIVNLEGDYQRTYTVKKDGSGYKLGWGEVERTQRYAIGTVGTGLFVSYQPKADCAEVLIEPANQVQGQPAKTYLAA